MSQLSFSWPWIFIFLPLPLLVLFIRALKTEASASSIAIRLPTRLQTAMEDISEHKTTVSLWQKIMPWLCWILLLIALSQPSLPGQAIAQPANGRAITLAIDLSGSMERDDFTLDGNEATRLTIVKRVAGQFIEKRRGDRLGLVLFGAEAFIASPLSFDALAVRGNLDSAGIGMAGKSTAIGDALGLAIQTLKDDPASEKAIVLLSDGTNNSGTVEPEAAAELARDHGIRVHAIALGSDREGTGYELDASADLDEATLKAIAEAANGQFFRAKTSEALNSVYNVIDKLETAEVLAPDIILQRDLRQYVLLLLLALLLLWELTQWVARR